MTKQEKIREGIAEWLWENRAGETTVQDWVNSWAKLPENRKQDFRKDATDFMIYLNSQGIVLKVDRELPECSIIPKTTGVCPYKKAGYGAVEPLIEEKTNG